MIAELSLILSTVALIFSLLQYYVERKRTMRSMTIDAFDVLDEKVFHDTQYKYLKKKIANDYDKEEFKEKIVLYVPTPKS